MTRGWVRITGKPSKFRRQTKQQSGIIVDNKPIRNAKAINGYKQINKRTHETFTMLWNWIDH